jgi:hypothetical protein
MVVFSGRLAALTNPLTAPAVTPSDSVRLSGKSQMSNSLVRADAKSMRAER